jgi:hypothetical protein
MQLSYENGRNPQQRKFKLSQEREGVWLASGGGPISIA